MLKNIHPQITGRLLDALRAVEPGRWIVLTNSPRTAAMANSIVPLETGFESASAAVLSVLPIHADDDAPIRFWLQDDSNDASWDVAFTLTGLARDGGCRNVSAQRVPEQEANAAVGEAALAIHVPDAGPDATFLLRVGDQHEASRATVAGLFAVPA